MILAGLMAKVGSCGTQTVCFETTVFGFTAVVTVVGVTTSGSLGGG
jgi:hypothetical protein